MGRRPPSVGILKSLDGRRARKYPENSKVEFGLCSLAPFCGGREREGGGLCIGVGWRSGTRLRRNVSQIIPNSNGQVGGPGPGPVVLSARCRACRGMKSIKAPVFEGRNRSPNPSFGSLPLVLFLSLPPRFARPSPFSSPCVCWGNARRAHYGGGGDERKGGYSVSIFNGRKGESSYPLFFSLSLPFFFFLFSYSSSCSSHRLFFSSPSFLRILLVKRRVPHRRMKKYILIHLMQFLFALCFFVEDFEASSSS